MRAENHIIILEVSANPGRNSLLTDVRMTGATYGARRVQFHQLLLTAPDDKHTSIQRELKIFAR